MNRTTYFSNIFQGTYFKIAALSVTAKKYEINPKDP